MCESSKFFWISKKSRIINILREGVKNKLIIFAKFSREGGGRLPPSMKIIDFTSQEKKSKSKNVQNALKHVKK